MPSLLQADDLLAELRASFPAKPRPEATHIVPHNDPVYDWEAVQIRDAVSAYDWPELPEAALRREQGGLNFMSNAGYRYYLPAYLSFAVRSYAASDSIPDRLVQMLTLPAEIDEVRSALTSRLSGLADQSPDLDWLAYHQQRLREMNEWVHYYMDRHWRFTPEQGRAVLHFLQFLQQEHRTDYDDDELATAIARYWFQFA